MNRSRQIGIPLLLLGACALFTPQQVSAAAYCVHSTSGRVVVCKEKGELDCSKHALPAPFDGNCAADSSSPQFCEFLQLDKSCKDIINAPGCCFCGTTPNQQVGSITACKEKCGSETAKFIQGSNCSDKAANEAKGGVAPSKAAPIPQPKNPLGTTSVPLIIGRVINTFLGVSGSLALLMFVYGGFIWITSGGAPDRITQGKNTMVWAALGVIFIFGAYAILTYIFKTLSA